MFNPISIEDIEMRFELTCIDNYMYSCIFEINEVNKSIIEINSNNDDICRII